MQILQIKKVCSEKYIFFQVLFAFGSAYLKICFKHMWMYAFPTCTTCYIMYLCIALRLLWRILKDLFCLVLIVTTSPVTEIVVRRQKWEENMEKSVDIFSVSLKTPQRDYLNQQCGACYSKGETGQDWVCNTFQCNQNFAYWDLAELHRMF